MRPDDNRRAPSYGIVERALEAGDTVEHAERIRLIGYTIVPSGFSQDDVKDLGARVDAVLQKQIDEFGNERMSAIGDELIARCLLAYDDTFLRLAAHATILSICRRLLGTYVVLLQQNGIVNLPLHAHAQRSYHRDLPYQHFVSSRPLAISAMFCIDQFHADNGATTVLPGSHHVGEFPLDSVAEQVDTPVTAEAGSFIVFDSMLFHRAGHNRSNQPRRAVNHVFGVPLLAQQISLPDALQGRYANDRELSRLLGYDVAPSASVVAWRQRRLDRER